MEEFKLSGVRPEAPDTPDTAVVKVSYKVS